LGASRIHGLLQGLGFVDVIRAVFDELISPLRAKFEAVTPHLNERQCRLLYAAEARQLGHGGIAAVARAAGVSTAGVSRGLGKEEGQAAYPNAPPADKDPITRPLVERLQRASVAAAACMRESGSPASASRAAASSSLADAVTQDVGVHVGSHEEPGNPVGLFGRAGQVQRRTLAAHRGRSDHCGIDDRHREQAVGNTLHARRQMAFAST
jgi:hypothetical protein